MNKQELNTLENAFECEVNGALTGNTGIFQTTSKIAEKLCVDGYLVKAERQSKGVFPMTISGYELTHAGRFACNEIKKQ